MTARQLELLRAIAQLTRPRGPTYRELCQRMGFKSTHAVADVVCVLQREGLVRVDARKSRGLLLTEKGAALAREVSL